jgi:hypothetical protein
LRKKCIRTIILTAAEAASAAAEAELESAAAFKRPIVAASLEKYDVRWR